MRMDVKAAMSTPEELICYNFESSAKTMTDTPTSTTQPSANPTNGHYYAFLVFYLVFLSALGSFVNDMYSPALPAMCRFFGCSIPLAQMGLTMGMVGLGVGQLILGPLSDHYGRKKVLLGSLLLFIVAAVASVFSPSIHVFNTCRLFQGMGASGGYFLARTIPADLYSGRTLARFMALVGAINGIAPASAPVLGGITSERFGWQAVFVFLAIIAAVILLLSPCLKESLPPSRRTKGAWWKALPGYITLLKNRPFMIHVSFKATALGLLFAYISASPFILQNHYGMSQTVYGLVIGANAISVAVGSMAALRFRPLKKAARAGSLILAAGIIPQAIALYTIHSIWVFEACMVVALFGLGLIFSTTNTLAMNEGRAKAGEASAILGVAGYIIGAIVAPLVGMGNVMHSTAIVFVALTILILICCHGSKKLAPDLLE